MALKNKYAKAEEIPADLKSFYVERKGAWLLDSERNEELRLTNITVMKERDALVVLPTLVVGNELFILVGAGAAVGVWFFAHRHGQLRGLVDANKNGVTDQLEYSETKENV
jgi:hypothetical protein